MSYKTLYITDNTNLSLRNNRIRVLKDEIDAEVPIEDISTVVVDGYKINLSLALINQLSERGVNLILCNDKKLPISSLIPFEQHSRQKKMLDIQIAATEPFKKKLWQIIIKQKIENQYDCLSKISINEDKLLSLSKNVKSGDDNNREAVASKIYFQHFLSGDFRSTPSKTNNLLDYAYAIVRSNIARSLAGYGFYTSLGIHHKSEVNQYNLADDFIEPFRPIVDHYVKKYLKEYQNEGQENEIEKEDKIFLVQVLNEQVIIDNEKHSLHNAIEICIKSLRTCFNEKDYSKLKLPTLC